MEQANYIQKIYTEKTRFYHNVFIKSMKKYYDLGRLLTGNNLKNQAYFVLLI